MWTAFDIRNAPSGNTFPLASRTPYSSTFPPIPLAPFKSPLASFHCPNLLSLNTIWRLVTPKLTIPSQPFPWISDSYIPRSIWYLHLHTYLVSQTKLLTSPSKSILPAAVPTKTDSHISFYVAGAKNLGVILDSSLSFTPHILSVRKSSSLTFPIDPEISLLFPNSTTWWISSGFAVNKTALNICVHISWLHGQEILQMNGCQTLVSIRIPLRVCYSARPHSQVFWLV